MRLNVSLCRWTSAYHSYQRQMYAGCEECFVDHHIQGEEHVPELLVVGTELNRPLMYFQSHIKTISGTTTEGEPYSGSEKGSGSKRSGLQQSLHQSQFGTQVYATRHITCLSVTRRFTQDLGLQQITYQHHVSVGRPSAYIYQISRHNTLNRAQFRPRTLDDLHYHEGLTARLRSLVCESWLLFQSPTYAMTPGCFRGFSTYAVLRPIRCW